MRDRINRKVGEADLTMGVPMSIRAGIDLRHISGQRNLGLVRAGDATPTPAPVVLGLPT